MNKRKKMSDHEITMDGRLSMVDIARGIEYYGRTTNFKNLENSSLSPRNLITSFKSLKRNSPTGKQQDLYGLRMAKEERD